MDRRKFLKVASVAPIAASFGIGLTPNEAIAKGIDIPLELPDREVDAKIDGAALISKGRIVAVQYFKNGGHYLIPGDELRVKWSCFGHNQFGRHIPTEQARQMVKQEIKRRGG